MFERIKKYFASTLAESINKKTWDEAWEEISSDYKSEYKELEDNNKIDVNDPWKILLTCIRIRKLNKIAEDKLNNELYEDCKRRGEYYEWMKWIKLSDEEQWNMIRTDYITEYEKIKDNLKEDITPKEILEECALQRLFKKERELERITANIEDPVEKFSKKLELQHPEYQNLPKDEYGWTGNEWADCPKAMHELETVPEYAEAYNSGKYSKMVAPVTTLMRIKRDLGHPYGKLASCFSKPYI